MINIALCFFDADGTYHLHAGVTMQSILANTDRPVCFHIVSKDLPPASRRNLEKVAEPYGAQVVYYDESSLDMTEVQHYLEKPGSNLKKFSRGVFYRLYLHKLIDLDKILYLDCDVVCNLDIAELYDFDVAQHMCAAVPDHGSPKHVKQLRFELGKYFNTGVLLLNLTWFRDNFHLVRKAINEFPQLPFFADQDILNAVAREGNDVHVLCLEEKFNFLTGEANREWLDDSHFRGKIIHITSRKPWAKWSNSCIQYWKYYQMCPWGQDVFEKMSRLAADLDKLFLQQFSSKEKRALRRFLDLRRLGLFGYFRKRLFKQKG